MFFPALIIPERIKEPLIGALEEITAVNANQMPSSFTHFRFPQEADTILRLDYGKAASEASEIIGGMRTAILLRFNVTNPQLAPNVFRKHFNEITPLWINGNAFEFRNPGTHACAIALPDELPGIGFMFLPK